VEVLPARKLHELQLTTRGALVRRHACALIAHLPEHIARRELRVVQDMLGFRDDEVELRGAVHAYGPGNAVTVTLASEQVTEVFAAFGARGVTAETVASNVALEARRYLASGAPVGVHLADQLLLPMALAGGGAFLAQRLSSHALTNIAVLNQFMNVPVAIDDRGDDAQMVRVGTAAGG
jgi:RNA 3'-terminal phosphate cyclase (ATP)